MSAPTPAHATPTKAARPAVHSQQHRQRLRPVRRGATVDPEQSAQPYISVDGTRAEVEPTEASLGRSLALRTSDGRLQ